MGFLKTVNLSFFYVEADFSYHNHWLYLYANYLMTNNWIIKCNYHNTVFFKETSKRFLLNPLEDLLHKYPKDTRYFILIVIHDTSLLKIVQEILC